MGAVKDLLQQFVEAVYPDSWDKQDELFEAIMNINMGATEDSEAGVDPYLDLGLMEYRRVFEATGEAPVIDLGGLQRLIDESNFAKEGWVRVVLAAECQDCPECGEPVCPTCHDHYADCECPGPTQDGYEYKEHYGVLFARRTGDAENDG